VIIRSRQPGDLLRSHRGRANDEQHIAVLQQIAAAHPPEVAGAARLDPQGFGHGPLTVFVRDQAHASGGDQGTIWIELTREALGTPRSPLPDHGHDKR
jgi:hypothetical protein